MEKTKHILRDIGLAALVILIAYIAIVYLILPLYTRHWQSISVPHVTGISQRAAEKVLQDKNLEPVKDIEKFDDRVPPGFIVFQNPEPDREVKKKRRIYLVISKGYRTIQMPDLIGIPIRDARFSLQENQLEIGQIEYTFHHLYPENVIIEQSIEPGSDIPVKSKVDLVLSLGSEPETIMVPSLTGNKLEEGLLKIKKAGLVAGHVNIRETTVFPDKTIINQSISSGQIVSRGDTLDITVSDNPTAGKEQAW
ncbi:MAG: PASTA domain-containing protein [candidate division KSB1 bacterium]|nr:PASTA domain-containing protein [candidate division KSB1 bacterium]